MSTRSLTVLACAVVLLGLGAVSGDAASLMPARTNHLTFSGAVSLPGMTLPRGTYTFQVIDLNGDVVRVLSRDGSRVYFMGFTIQVHRPANVSPDRLVTLTETQRDVLPRVDVWYPIGASIGHQFIYPDAAVR